VAAGEQRRAEEEAAGVRRGPGGSKPPLPAGAHSKVRKARAGLEQARVRAAEAERKAAQEQGNGPGPVRNITDPDARLMPVRGGGFIEGCNTQNAGSEDGLIIAAELTQDTTGTAWFEPMLHQAQDAAALITAQRAAAGHPIPRGSSPGTGDSDPGPGYRPPPPAGPATTWLIRLSLADAGYCSEDNINAPGPPRLIATGKLRHLEKAARTSDDTVPWASPALAAMASLLQTEDGITAYRQRGHIAETPHGHIKHNMRFRQLPVRGKSKAAAEWKSAAVHNLLKATSSGHLTTETLTRLQHRSACPLTTQTTPA
jgi:hypothetical protein